MYKLLLQHRFDLGFYLLHKTYRRLYLIQIPFRQHKIYRSPKVGRFDVDISPWGSPNNCQSKCILAPQHTYCNFVNQHHLQPNLLGTLYIGFLFFDFDTCQQRNLYKLPRFYLFRRYIYHKLHFPAMTMFRRHKFGKWKKRFVSRLAGIFRHCKPCREVL